MGRLYDPYENQNFPIFEKQKTSLAEIFFKLLRKVIIIPIVIFIKWVLLILLSMSLVPILYILINIFDSRYSPISDFFEFIKYGLDEFVEWVFNI